MNDAILRSQYEAYPYPARNPRDEATRLVTGSPSHRDEINHYLFAGRLDLTQPLRILVAGGGTGDGLVMLAQQFHNSNTPADITYLDLSEAAQALALARIEARGLGQGPERITFLQGSLLEAPQRFAEAPPFDYIDCCGVLHHLDDPASGLDALVAVLAPRGGIGLMVYAPGGRSGLYPLQAALRELAPETEPAETRIALARRVLKQLPPTHAFARNPFLSDHLLSDAGLYDLLLHSRDRSFTVPELAMLAENAGLAITSLIEPARYDPRSWFSDPKLIPRLDRLNPLERATLAENLLGHHSKHILYLTRPENAATAVARLDDPNAIPILKDGINGPAVARTLKPGSPLDADLDGLAVRLPLPRLAGPILSRIDGHTSVQNLFQALAEARIVNDFNSFATQFAQFAHTLQAINMLWMRNPPG